MNMISSACPWTSSSATGRSVGTLQEGVPIPALEEGWRNGLEEFQDLRQGYLLYEKNGLQR